MPKHADVFVCAVHILPRIAFAGKFVYCRNAQVVSNIKSANTKHLKAPKDDHQFKDNRQKILKLTFFRSLRFITLQLNKWALLEKYSFL